MKVIVDITPIQKEVEYFLGNPDVKLDERSTLAFGEFVFRSTSSEVLTFDIKKLFKKALNCYGGHTEWSEIEDCHHHKWTYNRDPEFKKSGIPTYGTYKIKFYVTYDVPGTRGEKERTREYLLFINFKEGFVRKASGDIVIQKS